MEQNQLALRVGKQALVWIVTIPESIIWLQRVKHSYLCTSCHHLVIDVGLEGAADFLPLACSELEQMKQARHPNLEKHSSAARAKLGNVS